MRNTIVLTLGLLLLPQFISINAKAAAPAEKEWTFLTFLNGNNNLDSFGAININQMEMVGSTDQINVVVQWASIAAGKAERLYIQKDNDPNTVTSPVVQDMGQVDMGDWHSVVDFVQWAVKNYPAKHYFLNIWDHGGGWHIQSTGIHANDISWDDNTGHFISTVQLGQALAESARIIGHKIDLYAADACLMAMAEVANEAVGSVEIYAGSQETEPGAGWPYGAILTSWVAKGPGATAKDIGTIVTNEYVKSYDNGSSGNADVTFSTFDLSKIDLLNSEVGKLGAKLMTLNADDRKKIVAAIGNTQSFAYSDYGDLSDFTTRIEEQKIGTMDTSLSTIRDAISQFVVANATTKRYERAKGVSIWLPGSMSTYTSYSDRYQGLKFETLTQWGNALKYTLQDATPPPAR